MVGECTRYCLSRQEIQEVGCPRRFPSVSAHGVDTWHAQHELAVVLIGRVADHKVLGRRVEVAQAPLQHAGVIKRPASPVPECLRGNLNRNLGSISGRAAHLYLKLQVRRDSITRRLPGPLQYFDDQGPGGA